MSSEDLQTLLNFAYFFLKFRPRTKKEMGDYLYKKIKRRHFSQDDVDKAIAHLEEQGLIDDRVFVEWFVEQRVRGKPKGRFVLKGELLRLGIAKDLIDRYFQENPLEEDVLALRALESKWRRFKNLPAKQRFEKAVVFLARRGFSFEASKKAIQVKEGES